MDKSTKYCELTVFLKNGQRATGHFHVPIRTSSAIRPSDALQEKKDSLLLLTNVTLFENNTPRKIPAVLMPYDSIAYIELPAGWTAKDEPEATPSATPMPAVTENPPPLRPPGRLPSGTPRWMAQTQQSK